MQLVNRGYIILQPTQHFLNWAQDHLEDLQFLDAEDLEPTIYLIEEDFIEDEPLIKKNYKKMFLNELMAVSEEEENYPNIHFDVFNEWFTCTIGSTVADCQSEQLQREEI